MPSLTPEWVRLRPLTRQCYARVKDTISAHPYLPVITLLAFVLMVYGTWRLQPHLTFPDETGAVRRALTIGYERDFFIDDFKKGGNLHLYLLSISFVPVVLFWVLTGRFGEITSSASTLPEDPSWGVPPELLQAYYEVMFAGRLLSAMFGVATVIVLYFLCTDIEDDRAGAFGATFLVLAAGYTMTAHYATEDVPMTFFLMLTFLLLGRAYRRSDRRYLLASAVVAGLGASAKATAGLVVLPIGAVIMIEHWPDDRDPLGFLTDVWRYPIATVAAYALTTPSLFVHFGGWVDEISRYVSRSSGDAVTYGWADPGWLVQLAHLAEAFGLPLFLFAVTSFVAAFAWLIRDETDPTLWFLASYAIPYFLIISQGNMVQFPRVLPLVPILAVFAGVGASRVHRSKGIVRRVGLGVLVVVLAFSAIHTGVAVLDMNQSRQQATDWNAGNLEDGATVDVYSQRVYLPEFSDDVTVNRYVIHSTYPREQWQPGLDRLACNAPEYVVLSSDHYLRFFRDPSVYPEVTEHMRELLRGGDYRDITSFGPPAEMEDSAGTKFRHSISLQSFPVDGNPTIVVLQRSPNSVVTCEDVVNGD